MGDEYITPAGLREIAEACETLEPLWELLTGGTGIKNVEFDLGNTAPYIYCYGSGGHTLGYISWGEDGPAFYQGKPPND